MGLERASENSSEISINFYRDKKLSSDDSLYDTFCYNQEMFVITNAERNTVLLTRTVK
jgi:hypothetical protein